MKHVSSAANSPSRVTIRDVAMLAGVHASTVSRVLNGDNRRAVAETRERIYEAARSLGWRPNSIARSLSLGRTYGIGMIIPDFGNPAYTSMISGAQRAAEDSGNVLLVTDTSDDQSRLREQLERMIDRVDGFIVASASLSSRAVPLLLRRSVPFVLLNRRVRGEYYSVIGDDETGVQLALDHLYSLGHRHIAYLAGQPDDIDPVERRLQAVREFTVGRTSARIDIVNAVLTPTEIADAVKHTFKTRAESPTALLAVNLLAAAEALTAIREMGLMVPEDVSVVGFDDWPLAKHFWVPLTAIRMPNEAMGRTAVEVVLQLLDQTEVDIETRVGDSPLLIERGSTATPPRNLGKVSTN